MIRKLFSPFIVLIGLVIFFFCIFNTSDHYVFLKTDGGHGQGQLYYDDGIWPRRIPLEYENQVLLSYADLSPDSSKIAFKQRSFLNIYDLNSNELTQLNTEPLYPSQSTSIQWSPDGSQIGFPCNFAYNGPIEVCAWDVAKGELRELSDLHEYGNVNWLSFGGWSADAKNIALIIVYLDYNSENEFQRILILDTDTGNVTPALDSQQAGLRIHPDIALSPDGKTILFCANTLLEEQEKDFLYTLYQINSDGSGLQRLVDLKHTQLLKPVWSPDGHSFYVNALSFNINTTIPLRYNLSGRLVGVLPFQFDKWILSWKSAIP